MNFSLPKKILIATNNKGKFPEIAKLLAKIGIESISAFDIPEPTEDGKTFEENSLLKAKYYAKQTNLISLADDSGLCVKALNNLPGIYSARFAINEETGKKDFNFAFEKIVKNLKEIGVNSDSKPSASFVCNLSLFDPKTNFSISFEGKVDGYLRFPALGNKGFGYDPIFVKNGMNQTFGEIDPELKDQISHRANAFEKLSNWLKSGL